MLNSTKSKTTTKLEFQTINKHNMINITVTLSARKSIAQPWRFFYGYFIKKTPLENKKLQPKVNNMPLGLEILTKNQHNKPNITVTLSARKSNAKPWRFFYARYNNLIFGGCYV